MENYINGEWVQARTDEYVEIIDPARMELLCECPMSGKAIRVGDGSKVREKAKEIEEKITDFYLKPAELSEGLLADIPRVLRKIAKKDKSG